MHWITPSFQVSGIEAVLNSFTHSTCSITLTSCSEFDCRQLGLLFVWLFTISRKEKKREGELKCAAAIFFFLKEDDACQRIPEIFDLNLI